MLTDLRRRMDEYSENLNNGKHNKLPNRSHRAEKYSNRTEKYHWGAIQQTKLSISTEQEAGK